MKTTKIQWCHSTINPVMGCDGCELWPTNARLATLIEATLTSTFGLPRPMLTPVVRQAVGCREMSRIYRDREMVADEIQAALGTTLGVRMVVLDSIRRAAKCYAGHLGTNRAGHKGYADQFEQPKLYAGRMAMGANWPSVTPDEAASKPWLAGCPRLIFISDMGDALSQAVPFCFLRQEIVDNVISASGQRHLWLWLTKRPARMAEFGVWLARQGLAWPGNLVAMTTITAQSKAGRLDQLRKVPSRWKGVSLEPLFEPLELCLGGIDWVIVGGGSDALAQPFHVEWALRLREQCKAAGVVFFLKQLGKRPFHQGQELALADEHGGDWNEWPRGWRVREVPDAFRNYPAKPSSVAACPRQIVAATGASIGPVDGIKQFSDSSVDKRSRGQPMNKPEAHQLCHNSSTVLAITPPSRNMPVQPDRPSSARAGTR